MQVLAILGNSGYFTLLRPSDCVRRSRVLCAQLLSSAFRVPPYKHPRFFACGGTRQLPLHIPGNSTLYLKGRYVATINNVSEVRKPLVARFCQRDDDIEVFKSFHQWEPDDLLTADYPAGGPLFDAFILLLAGGVTSGLYISPSNASIEECREAFPAAAWSGGNLDLIGDRRYWRYLKQLTSERRGEEFFRSAEGHVGLSPGGVQQGDIVVVLVGGNEPFVLRPTSTQTGNFHPYRLVGPCFLQGVMFGETLFGPLPEQWACILDGNLNTLQFCFRHRGTGEVTDHGGPKALEIAISMGNSFLRYIGWCECL